ncbi:MAG TPA: serine/threonine-protein kinase [Polyangiaceae bacterium]|nr:serine/threonine-protein kinase [Polyangiaceae bacterium]
MNVATPRSSATGATASAVLPTPGQVLGGKYRIERTVAWGGMAAILAAEHLVLGQRVAVKVMLGDPSEASAGAARMLREARASARLQSTHVARVFDAGVIDGGAPFLVMEYLEGRDLAAVLAQRGPLDPAEVVDLALQALEGLAHAHAAGIVHRDLKPANLFLADAPDGSVTLKLLDFGISMSLVDSADARAPSLPGAQVVGSPMYMSPEQVHNPAATDARSDIWSLGVTLYELLTGVVPFEGQGIGETLAAILEQMPAPVRSRRPEVPEGLDPIVQRCLERDRGLRYGDVAELARALAPFGTGQRAALVERISATLANAREPSSLDPMMVTLPEAEVDVLAPTMPPPAEPSAPSQRLALVRSNGSARPAARPRSTRYRWTAGVGGAAAAFVVFAAFALPLRTRAQVGPVLAPPPALALASAPALAPTPALTPVVTPDPAPAPQPARRPASSHPSKGRTAAPKPAPPVTAAPAAPVHRIAWPGAPRASR